MKKTVLFAAVALILTACDKNDENIIISSTAAQISATIGNSAPTRASDNSWTQGDEIGIYSIIGGVKQRYINVPYTTDGGESAVFTGDTPIYFYNKMALTAYYPFQGTEGTVPGLITASTDAANQTSDKQPKIDFLYAQVDQVKVSNPEINFSFAHKMTKLTFIFENGNPDTDVSKITQYELTGLVMDGKFNTETGECMADDTTARTIVMPVSGVVPGQRVPSIILFPQKTGIDSVKLRIHSNEVDNTDAMQDYICTLNFDENELKPGNNYVCTIKVTKTGISVDKTSITNWQDVVPDEPFSGASE